MIEEEEEDSDIIENNFLKLNSNNITDSISITALNDDASTYMGVKSVADEQNININATKNKNKDIKNDTNHKKKKKKKEDSFSSLSESKSSESPKKDKRNSFTDLLKKVKKNKEKKEDKKNKEVKEEKNIKKNKGSSKKTKKVEEIETKFEWAEGGSEVYVSGSFCDWKKFYIMIKDNDGIFHLTLSLPRGFHQYKFKVDENWTYSKIQPKYEDNGNVNNFIDTTDYNNLNEYENNKENEREIELFDKNNDVKKKAKKSNEKIKKRNSSILSVNFLNSLNCYTIYYPLKSEFNKNPVPLPGLYKTCFILNEDFKQKEEKKFAEVEFINSTSTIDSSERSLPNVQNKTSFLGEVIPYVKFQNLYHIHSNHLHSKLFHNYMKTAINSMTARYRFKFTTFIYYKSKEPVKKIKRRKNHSKTVKCPNSKNDK